MRRHARTPVLTTVALLGTSALTVSLLAAPADAGPRRTRVMGDLTATVSHPGGAVVMVGRVKDKGKHERTVVLEQKIASGWRKVGKTRTSRAGVYSVAVPTHWFHSSKLRARVTKNRKLRGGTSRSRRFSVVPAYTPMGSADQWGWLSSYQHHFNPCKTVTYGINTSRATPDAATVTAGIHNTIGLVAQATGIRFRFVGETSAMPYDGKVRRKDPDLVFGFTTDAETRLDLGPSVAARGGSDKSRWARNARGKRIAESLSAGVIYDLTDTATMTAAQFQGLTMHEVGHAMGLAHTSDPYQFMTPGEPAYVLPHQYGAGDLTGFSKLGLESGCLRPFRFHRKPVLPRLPVPVVTSVD
jgi:hypothetical protein